MKYLKFIFFLVVINGFSQNEIKEPDPDILYKKFTEAYDELDADSISELYTHNASILNLYDSKNPNSINGTDNIKNYFRNFFNYFKKNNRKLQLTFKIINRKKRDNTFLDNGYYRLEILTTDKSNPVIFGKFSTVIVLENEKWKFSIDASTDSDFMEYENAGGGLILKRHQ